MLEALVVAAASFVALGLLTVALLRKEEVKIYMRGVTEPTTRRQRVFLLPNAGAHEETFAAALKSAAEVWERAAGKQVFSEFGAHASGMVVLVTLRDGIFSNQNSRGAMDLGPCCFGVAYSRIVAREGRIQSAAVFVHRAKFLQLSHAQQVQALAHELGHVLGFGHVSDSWSLMHPTIFEGEFTVAPHYRRELR